MIFIILTIIAVVGIFTAGTLVNLRLTESRRDAVRELNKPTPSIQRVPKGSRDEATLNERWIEEQEHELNPKGKRADFSHSPLCRNCEPIPLRRHEVPSIYDHVFWGDVDYRDSYGRSTRAGVVSGPANADVVTSEVEGTKMHTPMLDIDLPARLIPSSTPGAYHLYVDAPMTWRNYRRLLRVLYRTGVIEKGFYKASLRRKATHLRVPWKDKAA